METSNFSSTVREIKDSITYIYAAFSDKNNFFIELNTENTIFFLSYDESILIKSILRVEKIENYVFLHQQFDPSDLLNFLELLDESQTVELRIMKTGLKCLVHNSREFLDVTFLEGDGTSIEHQLLVPTNELPSIMIDNVILDEFISKSSKILNNSPTGIADVLNLFFSYNELRLEVTDVKRFLKITRNIQFDFEARVSITYKSVVLWGKILKLIRKQKIIFSKIFFHHDYILFTDISEKNLILKLPQTKYMNVPLFDEIKKKYSFNNQIQVNKKEFMNCIKKIDIVSKNSEFIKYFFILHILKNALLFQARNNKTSIETKLNLNTLNQNVAQIGLHSKLLTDLIALFDENEITILSSGEFSPLHIFATDDIECLITPFSENNF